MASEQEPSSPPSLLRDQLLKLNGGSAVGEELGRLNKLIEQEESRVRRLRRWTIGVWISAVLMLVLPLLVSAVLYFALSASPPAAAQGPTTTVTTTSPATMPSGQRQASTARFIAPIITTVTILAIPLSLVLVVVGIVLLVMLLLARRTANMNQVRAALASIDAQLRLLTQRNSGP